MSLLTIPDELVLSIAVFVSKLSDLNAFARTCSRLYSPLNDCLYSRDAKSNEPLALAWAARYDLEETARHSIARGANIETRQHQIPHIGPRSSVLDMKLDNLYPELLSPLQRAVLCGSASVFSLLLDCSVNIHETYPRSMKSCTLLHVAGGKGLINFVKMLIDRGAEVNALDKLRRTPLHYAVRGNMSTDWHDRARTVSWLLEKGADPDAEDTSKKSPKALAKQSPNSFVRMMFKPGAKIAQYESLLIDTDILEIWELKRRVREVDVREEQKRQQQKAALNAEHSYQKAERARRIAKEKKDIAAKKEAARKAQASLDAVSRKTAQQEMIAEREKVVASLLAAKKKEEEAALAEQRRLKKQEKARSNWSQLRQEAESKQHRVVDTPRPSFTNCSHLWWKHKSRESCQVCQRKLGQSSFRCANCDIKVCQRCHK